MGGNFGLDEDLASLRNQVSSILSKKGVLDHLKAQMRSAVIASLNEENIPLSNPKLNAITSTPHGKLAIDLIAEFLDFCDMKQTYTVFEPEAQLGQAKIDATSLSEKVKLSQTPSKTPVLVELIQQYLRDSEVPNSVNHGNVIPKVAPIRLTSPPQNPNTLNTQATIPPKTISLVPLQSIPPPPPTLARSGSSSDNLNKTKTNPVSSSGPVLSKELSKSTETVIVKSTPTPNENAYADDDFEEIEEELAQQTSESEFLTSDRSITPTRATEGLDYVETVEQ